MTSRIVDIGVEFEKKIDTSFMDEIMSSGIADSNLDNDDLYFDYANDSKEKLTEKELEELFARHGMSYKEFLEW